jgi:hypothetical protein
MVNIAKGQETPAPIDRTEPDIAARRLHTARHTTGPDPASSGTGRTGGQPPMVRIAIGEEAADDDTRRRGDDVAAIAELTREHDAVVALVSQARAAHGARDVTAMAVIARRIAVVLGPHTQVEQEGLFPALDGDFPDQVAALRAEHRLVEAELDAAAVAVPTETGWPDRLLATLDMLREHILKEQDGVFPAALTSLRTTDWEAVDAVRARVGSAAAPPNG